MAKETFDRLDQSRKGLIVVIWVTVFFVLTLMLSFFIISGSALKTTRDMIQIFCLDTPAIVPTGRPMRHARYWHPAMDLRHAPFIPQAYFSPERLIIGSSGGTGRITK